MRDWMPPSVQFFVAFEINKGVPAIYIIYVASACQRLRGNLSLYFALSLHHTNGTSVRRSTTSYLLH